MIKTKKWRDAEAESDVKMHVEDWMADEIDGLREELTEAYKQRAELLEALKSISDESGPPIGRAFGQMNRIAAIAHAVITRAEATE